MLTNAALFILSREGLRSMRMGLRSMRSVKLVLVSTIWVRVRALLSAYEPPPLDPSRDEALREYIERCKRMMPDEFA